jgi:ParB/RepB/Spo0J family partition protein
MSRAQDLPLDQIDADPEQPRQHIDGISGLGTSMAEMGLISSIVVRADGDRYIVVSGERRYRAAKMLEWGTIPAQVKNLSKDEAFRMSLAENVQRQSMSPVEEARAFKKCLGDMTREKLGQLVGRERPYITQKLRLLQLPRSIQFYLDAGGLTEAHARQLLTLKALYGDLQAKIKGADDAGFPEGDEVFMFLSMLRPEDRPLIPFRRGLSQIESVTEAVRLFCEDLDRSGSLPQWTVTALWWASMAVCLEMTVADLTTRMTDWRSRFLSGALWLSWHGGDVPADRLDEILLRGYRSDQRHAGVDDITDLPTQTLYEALGLVQMFVPTQAQDWGDHGDEYLRLSMEREESMEEML